MEPHELLKTFLLCGYNATLARQRVYMIFASIHGRHPTIEITSVDVNEAELTIFVSLSTGGEIRFRLGDQYPVWTYNQLIAEKSTSRKTAKNDLEQAGWAHLRVLSKDTRAKQNAQATIEHIFKAHNVRSLKSLYETFMREIRRVERERERAARQTTKRKPRMKRR